MTAPEPNPLPLPAPPAPPWPGPRVVKLLATLVALVAMMGAESPGCERRGVDTDRPPQDRQQHVTQQVVLITGDSDGPYTIIVRAKEQGKPGTDTIGPELVAGGEFKDTLRYASGLKINITVTLYGNHKQIFYCVIADGPHVIRKGEPGAVTCQLTTRR